MAQHDSPPYIPPRAGECKGAFPRVWGNQAGVLGGCAGGVAPLRPYDMVGREFRCFATAQHDTLNDCPYS